MEINGIKIKPGEQKSIEINIARLPSHASIDIVIKVARATSRGPVLLLMGGLHGDEINGVEIIRRIVERKLNIPTIGTVICIPILNIFGFIHFSRYVPDGKDVNRSFPGNRNGSLAARVAYYLMKNIVPIIDYGVDFHTGGDDRFNYPQIRCMLNDDVNQKLAKAFCAPFTLDSKYRPRSLRQTAAKMGKRILVYEGGESSRFDEYAIEQGIQGAMRLMHHLNMTKEYPQPELKNKVISKSSWIRARHSGMFLSSVKCGAYVKRNQIVGYINDPYGDLQQTIKAQIAGNVIGLNNNPIVHQGDALMHIGVSK